MKDEKEVEVIQRSNLYFLKYGTCYYNLLFVKKIRGSGCGYNLYFDDDIVYIHNCVFTKIKQYINIIDE